MTSNQSPAESKTHFDRPNVEEVTALQDGLADMLAVHHQERVRRGRHSHTFARTRRKVRMLIPHPMIVEDQR